MPFEVLGVRYDASKKEAKEAFAKLAHIHHPDKGGDPDTFQAIKQAYDEMVKADKGEIQFAGARDFNEVRPPPRFPSDDSAVIVNLPLTVAQIKDGATQQVVYKKSFNCNHCLSTGLLGDGLRCTRCHGHGFQTVAYTLTINVKGV